MGDRVSVSFKNKGEESVVLFDHWGGREFAEKAADYAERLKEEVGNKETQPLDRLEPNTVMVDFIREVTKDMERVVSGLYLGATPDDGDSSDNGHFTIDVTK